MATPYFVADSASVTIMRSLASSSYGSYSLNLPDGIELEDVHDFDAPDNTLGYVAHVGHGQRVGGLARRFVRADVNVSAADPSDPDRFPDSDVDRVLRGVAERVSGDFFLESDVSKAGLGPWVPHVDFKVGDLARVEIWGQVVVLPVTRIEEVVSDHDIVDWLVHVGGQLVSDEEARKAENLALHRAFLQDRRELAGVEGIASQAARTADEAQEVATTAKSTAETAKSTAESARDLAGLIDLDLDGVVDVIAQGLDVEVPEGKETRAMFAIAQVLALAIQANQRAIAAETEARTLLEREATRMVWADAEKAVRNDDVKLSNPSWARSTVVECFGDWEGMVVLHVVTESVHPTGLVTGVKTLDTFQRRWFVTKTSRTFSHNNGSGPSVLHSTLFYQKWSPGTTPEETTNNA